MGWFENSDAGHWTMLAFAALAVAAVSWLGDWRRARRAMPDQVGWVPWTGVFMAALLAAAITGLLALESWLNP